jgi:hypothetical protein
MVRDLPQKIAEDVSGFASPDFQVLSARVHALFLGANAGEGRAMDDGQNRRLLRNVGLAKLYRLYVNGSSGIWVGRKDSRDRRHDGSLLIPIHLPCNTSENPGVWGRAPR